MKKIYLFLLASLFTANQNVNAQACTGTPASNVALATSTAFCAGTTATLSLQTPYTASGIVYQWAYSTGSALGPWTPISGANSPTLATTTLTDAAFYTAVIGCTNSFLSTTATAVYLNISTPGATTTVPYYETFQVNANNTLPNCSWGATSLGTNCLTYSTVPFSGGGVAAFAYSATVLGPQSFYSMGVYLNANVVYSVSIWHTLLSSAQVNNWSNFGLSVGPSQSAAGSTVVTASGPPTNGTTFTDRSGTFSVPSNGIYYVRVFSSTISGSTVAPFLYFDELSITLPCSIAANGGSATLTASSFSICAGSTATVTVNPAPNCTVTGGNVQYVTPFPSPGAYEYTTSVTNTITGCVNTSSINFHIDPDPNVNMTFNTPEICVGGSAIINAFAAGNYTLLPGGNTFTTSIQVNPTSTTAYTVEGSNQFGCIGKTALTLSVKLLPTIVLSPATATVCKGESASVNATGAASYTIGSNAYQSTITVPPVTKDSVFVIVATGINGCQNTTNFSLKVTECAGIPNLSGGASFALFPNPNTGTFKIVIAQEGHMTITDVSGRLIFTSELKAGSNALQLTNLNRGLYFIEVQTDSGSTKKQLVID